MADQRKSKPKEEEAGQFAIQRSDGLFYGGTEGGEPRFTADAQAFEEEAEAQRTLDALDGDNFKIVALT